MEICSNNKAKHRSQKLAFGIFRLLSLCIVLILFAILGFIIYKGSGAISWEFITSAPTDGMRGGGIWPAIVGTFYLMVGSALFAFPVGVMSGIYMNEYAPKGKLVRFIRVMTNNLSGIPSIVFGLFGMALFVNYMGFGDSILAGIWIFLFIRSRDVPRLFCGNNPNKDSDTQFDCHGIVECRV